MGELFVPAMGAPKARLLNADVPDGVSLLGLDHDVAKSQLGSVLANDVSGFVALNTANLADTLIVHVGRGVHVEEPLNILLDAPDSEVPTIVHPRVLIVLEESAQATIVSRFEGDGTSDRLMNAVTEVVVGDNAQLDHVVVQDGPKSSHSIHTVGARVGAHGCYRSTVFELGCGIGRTEMRVSLEGQGGETWVDGAYIGDGDRQLDQYTLIDHQAERTTSGEIYKGVLRDRAVGTFQGRILIHPNTPGCSTSQLNRNLVLSEGAVANTKPQLEIGCDEVRASHGATVGQLDPVALHYLRTRGLGTEDAQALLLMGFVREAVDRVRHSGVRDEVWGRVLNHLGVDDLLAKDAVS
jgi:Fe-S cluster assembly protein SufD